MVRKAVVILLVVAALGSGAATYWLDSRAYGVRWNCCGRDVELTVLFGTTYCSISRSRNEHASVLHMERTAPDLGYPKLGVIRTRADSTMTFFPRWLPSALLGAYPLFVSARYFVRRWRRREPGVCGKCGYDLTGNVSGVCPECGTEIHCPPPGGAN